MADPDQPPAEPTATLNIVNALLDPDDLVAVLRSQLFIEYALEQLIAIVTGEDSRPLFEFMDFSRKIDAAKSLGILETHDATALQAVGRMRNKFAHRPRNPSTAKNPGTPLRQTNEASYARERRSARAIRSSGRSNERSPGAWTRRPDKARRVRSNSPGARCWLRGLDVPR